MMSPVIRHALIALVWAISSLTFGFWMGLSLIGNLACALTVCVATLIGSRPLVRTPGLRGWLWPFLLISIFFVLPLIVDFLPIPGVYALHVQEWADLAPFMAVVVFGLRRLSVHVTALRVIESGVIVLLVSSGLSPHRHGNFYHPRNVVDPWVIRGWDPSWLLWITGAVVSLMMVTVLLPSTRSRRPVTILFLAAFLLALALTATRFLPALAFTPPLPPPPPALQSPEPPPPPPPPPPEPIAYVEFKDLYPASQRVSGHYFRQATYAVVSNASFAFDRVEFPTELLPQSFDADAATNMTPDTATSLVDVRLLVSTNHFVLPGTLGLALLPSPPAPFIQAYQLKCLKFGAISFPDPDPESLRSQLESSLWSPEEKQAYLEGVKDQSILDLVAGLTSDIPSFRAKYLPPRLGAIRSWINNNLAFSDEAAKSPEANSVTNFLFSIKAGGHRQFAEAAGILFRAAGIPSRLASGFVVPVDQTKPKYQFVVTDAHQQFWPEVYVEGSGWLPVPLNPTNILDRANPPPDPELDMALRKTIDHAAAPSKRFKPGEELILAARILAGVLAFWLALVLYHRSLCIWFGDKQSCHRKAILAAQAALAGAGWYRHSGETYEMFANRIRHKTGGDHAAVADAWMKIVLMHRDAYEQKRIYDRMTWAKALHRLKSAITLSGYCRGIPLVWFNATRAKLRPFSSFT